MLDINMSIMGLYCSEENYELQKCSSWLYIYLPLDPYEKVTLRADVSYTPDVDSGDLIAHSKEVHFKSSLHLKRILQSLLRESSVLKYGDAFYEDKDAGVTAGVIGSNSEDTPDALIEIIKARYGTTDTHTELYYLDFIEENVPSKMCIYLTEPQVKFILRHL